MRIRLTLAQIEKRLRINRSRLRQIAATASNAYNVFEKATKSGKVRLIEEPHGWLKSLQTEIRQILEGLFAPPRGMHGCVKGRSALSAAKPHCAQPLVMTFDIANCFPSITTEMTRLALISRLDVAPNLATLLAQILTRTGHLPQGSPSSPFVANVVLAGFWEQASGVCRDRGLNSTIYVDDVTISGPAQAVRGIVPEIFGRLGCHGFSVKRSKIRISGSGRKSTLGLVVNGRWPTVGDRHKRELSSAAHQILSMSAPPIASVRSVIGRAVHLSSVSSRQGRTLAPTLSELRALARTLGGSAMPVRG